MKTKIIIADIYYTSTDETYYVLSGSSRFRDDYKVHSLREAFTVLRADGWSKCGKVQRSDYTPVDMFIRNNDQIAIWQETEINDEEQEEEELLKGLGCSFEDLGNEHFFYLIGKCSIK